MCFGFVGMAQGVQVSNTASGSGAESRRAGSEVLCGGCGRSYELPAWLGLPIVGVLQSDAIAAHVVKWPRGVRIEIRKCARCGRSIARTEGPANP
jgi:hypothetical protein